MRTDMRDGEPQRRRAFRIAAVVLGLVFGVAFFGFPGLVIGWFEGGERLVHRVHDLGAGILNGILFSVAFFALAARPANVAALHQVAVAVAAGLVAAAVSADVIWLGLVSGGIVGVGVLLATAGPAYRRRFLRPAPDPNPLMGVLAAAALVPLTAYALSMAELQRSGIPGDSHVDEHHWAQMASMAIAIGAVGLVSAIRTPGWRIPARCAGAAAIVFGVASIVFPGHPGSAGDGWGFVALIGGAAWIGAAEWEARRREPA